MRPTLAPVTPISQQLILLYLVVSGVKRISLTWSYINIRLAFRFLVRIARPALNILLLRTIR